MAVPVARQHGPGLRAGRDQGRQGHLLERNAEVPLPATRHCRHARRPARQSARDLDAGARLLWPQRCRRLPPWTPPFSPRRSASRCGCNTCATRAPAGIRKGPASIHKARAAIDAAGKVTAYEFTSKASPRVDVNTNGSKPWDTLAGQMRGVPLKSGDGFGVPAESYAFDNKQLAWETIPPLLDRASPLRTSHLRDPVGPQIHFASESFMDEVAAGARPRCRSSSACGI